MFDAILSWFVWIALAFFMGVIMHWWISRKERRLLKLYRKQAYELRQWIRPIE